MTDLNELKKLGEFDVHLRKPYDELNLSLEIINNMVLKGDHCLIEFRAERKIFRIKVHRCRQSFSSMIVAGVVKETKSELTQNLTFANMVTAYHGFLQFSIKNSKPSKNSKSIHGPIIHIDIYEPKDPVYSKDLKQVLESI